jgi:segregation and condensation protein A
VAAELSARHESEAKMHPRQAGLEPDFLALMPDYLEGVTLRGLAVICADLLHRRDVFLLEAEHVASMPISLEAHAVAVWREVSRKKRVSFSELLGDDMRAEIVVVTFLAILELYKRGEVELSQDEVFGDIVVTEIPEGEREARAVPDHVSAEELAHAGGASGADVAEIVDEPASEEA